MIWFLCYLGFGAAVGGIAKWILPGRLEDGWIPAIALGIASSMVAGFLFEGQPAGWVLSVVTAVVLIYLYGQLGGSDEGSK